MYNNPYAAYQKTQVTTAKPDRVLLMLYEGAIRFCKLAAIRIREKNIPEKGKYISKTLAIISELMNTLNHEVGGQLTSDLEGLYMFMMDKLIDANIKNSAEDCEVVERLLTTLYDAWKDVVENPRPDGVPSRELQPELFETWNQAQKGGNGKAPAAPQNGAVAPTKRAG